MASSTGSFFVATRGQNQSSTNYGATYYKVYAYTKNKIAQSEIVEYSFIIDQFNYYFDSENASEIQIGTVNFFNPMAGKEIIEEMEAFCKSQGIKDINEIVGII